MDNRVRYPRYGHKKWFHANNAVVLQDGYAMKLGETLFFRPDRGSGGFGLYSTAKRAKGQLMNTEERPVKGRLVFIPDTDD